MFENIGSKVQEAYSAVQEKGVVDTVKDLAQQAYRSTTIRTAGAIIAGGIALGTGNANAQRIIDLDADPAAYGVAGAVIDPSDWKVEYFATDNPDRIGFRLYNPDGQHTEIRGFLPVQDGETFVLDGVGLFPYTPVDASTIGTTGSPTEMPGSAPGIDNLFELESAIRAGSPQFRLRTNDDGPIGTVDHYFDEDGLYTQTQREEDEASVLNWNPDPAGYSFNEPLTRWQTFQSSQGNPAGWSPTDKQNWIRKFIDTNDYEGETDLATTTMRLSRWSADRMTMDNETLQANTHSAATPFFNVPMGAVPDAYKLLMRMQNFSNIQHINGNQTEIVRIGATWTGDYGFGAFAPNADDGSGQLPNGIPPESEKVQEDFLNSEGSAMSTITQPPVATENVSWSDIKAMFR